MRLAFLAIVLVACGGAVEPSGHDEAPPEGPKPSCMCPAPPRPPPPPPPPDPNVCQSPPSPGTSSPCTPPAGTYVVHYEKLATDDARCADVPDETVTGDPSDAKPPACDFDGDGDVADQDSRACTWTKRCIEGGTASWIETRFDLSTCGAAITGTFDMQTVTNDGVLDCKYVVTVNKQ